MTALRRPMRTFSATTAGAVAAGNNNNTHAVGAMPRKPLLRHHSEIPWHMRSLDRQHSRAPNATSPSTAAGPVLMPVLRSPKSHPAPLHIAHSCPQQHQLLGGTNSDGLLLSPVSSNLRSQPHNTYRDNTGPTPKYSLDQATKERACSTAQQHLRAAATASSAEPQKRPRSPEDESSQHSEVAEAAETMILFMKSEASSQNDLSTPSFSPPQLHRHSPPVSPPINSASEAASSFAHPGSISGANSSVDKLQGNTQYKRPRPGMQSP
ncbi:hypothetical protein GGI22_005548 [Coemansia erecta]|nr:hypothetical protein GGI22_005548 [Coemansia erecta]